MIQEKIPKPGEIVEGIVIGKERAALFVDLGKWGVGRVWGREYLNAKEEIKKMKAGDKIFVRILKLEDEQGYLDLSLEGVKEEVLKEKLREKREKGEPILAKVVKATKGGIICDLNGVLGFLPYSQSFFLPNKNDLETLIGKEIKVKIASVFPNKLILSQVREAAQEIKEGEMVLGEVSGITSFGVFLKFGDKEGLIPFSFLNDKKFSLGQKVKAKIVKISNGKIFLGLE